MWEKRFSTPEYLFGIEPAEFVRREALRLAPASEILCLADGERLNSVHLARLGHRCTAMEFAPSAIAKGRALAKSHGVDVSFVQADIRDWDWQSERFDAVMAIFIQFADPDLRDDIFAGTIRTLRPGGLIFVHGYTPAQLEFNTGGPPQAENLYTAECLTRAFVGIEILRLREYEATLDEGCGHRGRSALVDLIARKP
jgi:2-polyprenyl-3-methyl-5-hydroxy-6-metoxy-1,4-benzoquinol methylase